MNINVRNDLILFHILKVYVKFSQRRRDDGGNRHYMNVYEGDLDGDDKDLKSYIAKLWLVLLYA